VLHLPSYDSTAGTVRVSGGRSFRGPVAAGTVVCLLLLTLLVATDRLDLNKAPRAAAVAGCSRLPAQPPPIPDDVVLARSTAGTVAIASPLNPPQKETIDGSELVRVDLKIEKTTPLFDAYNCQGTVTTYIPWLGAAPVPPELVPSPGKRLLVQIAAIRTSERGVLPALAVPPLQVARDARLVIVEGRSAPPPKQASQDLPSFSVGLASQKFATVLPDPQMPLQVEIANTTGKTIDAQTLQSLGIQKWTATLSSVAGSFTAASELDVGRIPKLEPGQSFVFTALVTFREGVDRHLAAGNAVLTGQLQSKTKPIEAPGIQITISEAP
jgi:hypothetical protein